MVHAPQYCPFCVVETLMLQTQRHASVIQAPGITLHRFIPASSSRRPRRESLLPRSNDGRPWSVPANACRFRCRIHVFAAFLNGLCTASGSGIRVAGCACDTAMHPLGFLHATASASL
jgi:hypothetical protein